MMGRREIWRKAKTVTDSGNRYANDKKYNKKRRNEENNLMIKNKSFRKKERECVGKSRT